MIRQFLSIATVLVLGASCSRKNHSPASGAAGEADGKVDPAPTAPMLPAFGPEFLQRPGESDVIGSSPNYNEDAVREAESALAALAPAAKAALLEHIKAGHKINAIKDLRATSGTGLLVSKLAVELLAVRNGINPGILKPEAR